MALHSDQVEYGRAGLHIRRLGLGDAPLGGPVLLGI